MAAISRFIGKSFSKLTGWKFVGEIPDIPKYVLIVAPHTSVWDVLIGKMYNWSFDMRPKIMIKKEFFFFPVGMIIRYWGAIPVDREYPGGIVNQMAERFKQSDKLIITVTPEGTRKPNPNWKTGFYRIAQAAKVPVYLSFIDFKTKRAGLMGEFKMTGDMEKDIETIKEKYRGMQGFHKGNFAL